MHWRRNPCTKKLNADTRHLYDIEHRLLPLLGGFLAKKVGKKLAQKAGGVAVDLLAKNPTGAVIAKGLDDSGTSKVNSG